MEIPDPNFNFSSPDYRYSFNGKEKDAETVGTSGGTQDFGARIYNPSLGRWLSIDPEFKKYPYASPYSAFGNDPIYYVDPGGDILRVAGDEAARATAQAALQKLTNDKVEVLKDGTVKITSGNENPDKKLGNGTFLIKSLVAEEKVSVITLVASGKNETDAYEGGNSDIRWNPNSRDGGVDEKGNTDRDPSIGLGHELIHALINMTGIGLADDEDVKFSDPDQNNDESAKMDFEEYNTRVLENGLREEQDITKRRIPDKMSSDGMPIPENGSGTISPNNQKIEMPKPKDPDMKEKSKKKF